MVAEAQSEIKILLYQNDCHIPTVAEHADHFTDLRNDIWLYALGRLVQQQQLGPGDQGARNGKLLLLPTGQIPAASRHEVLQDRKELKDLIGDASL